jgi:hypothetical protein
MVAVSGGAALDEAALPASATFSDAAEALERQVRHAQEELARGVERAGLLRDPYRHLMAAQSAALAVFPPMLRSLRAAVDQAREPVDPASVEKLAQAAASGAERNAGILARAHSLRTVLIAAGTIAGAVLTAGIGGFAWGFHNATSEWQAVGEGVQQAAFQRGPTAASAWLGLLNANDPTQALAGCTSASVKVIEGRRACEVPMWLDPPRIEAPALRR